ncbi:MAG: type II secretion system protein GspJ [Myxococcota bacterium]|nr:type II secretion system protein GspJ [Myxococcota bacterium]
MSCSSQRGLTLAELLIAIVILAVISALSYSAVSNAADMAEEAQARRQLDSMGRNAVNIMARELSQAFISQNQTDFYRTQFKGTDRNPIDEVYFVARAHEKRYANVKEGDIAEYGYWSEAAGSSAGNRNLIHRESPIVDDDPERGGTLLVLSRSVHSLNLRYYDQRKEEWLDEWDSEGNDTQNRAPDAIEIKLELEDEQGHFASFFMRTQVLP